MIILALLILAGEPIRFDADHVPQFSATQIEGSAEATRAGLVKWAATPEGRAILARFQTTDREVQVIEDADEPSIGRAPQPNFVTLLAAGDRKKQKTYRLILNPALAAQYDHAHEMDLGLPRTPAEVMALAWAGEMLHIDFYAKGVALPHHARGDFQERWESVAKALGLPRALHETDSVSAAANAPPNPGPRRSPGQIYRVP
jgi:hypothetical protein